MIPNPHAWRYAVLAIVAMIVVAWLLGAFAPRSARADTLLARGVGATGRAAPRGGPVTATAALRRPKAIRVAPVPIRPLPAALRASVTGNASWYCKPGRSTCTVGHPGGHYAAAGPKLRALLGRYMGRTVSVCTSSACTQVTVIDWCGCPDGRVLDLYADAFDDLAGLGAGVVSVRVTP
jgi:rare lipoprotein A (peptidoglycan hydrolase)